MPIITPNGGSSGGAAFTIVSCVLGITSLDVHAAGTHPLKWTALADNVWDFNPLGAIPAGLGLSFVFDGSSSAITATADGTWAFTCSVGPLAASDATFGATLTSGFSGVGAQAVAPLRAADILTVTEVITLPATASGGYTVETVAPATANPYAVTCALSIVRLG